jgi:predicted DNA-binding transcriptional regulator YafY
VRAERLLRLMFLLRAHGRTTARDLATRLGVSTRTIQRDLDALSLAGVPVYAERGRGGGWVLASDYRTRLDGLTPAETMAVFLGTAGHVLADLGLAADAASGYAKLLATVPAHARPDAEHARSRFLVDHTGWQGPGDRHDWLGVLQHGVWHDRRVRIRYGGHDRTVDPLGLVAKAHSWYLVAARSDGHLRTYRISRVTRAELTDEGFTRPPGFDLPAYWEQATKRYFAGLRDYPVRLRVRHRVAHRLWWAPNVAIERVSETGDGWCEVSATFEKAYETRVFLLGLAGDVVVLEPAELRHAMTAAARDLLAQHPESAKNGPLTCDDEA